MPIGAAVCTIEEGGAATAPASAITAEPTKEEAKEEEALAVSEPSPAKQASYASGTRVAGCSQNIGRKRHRPRQP